MSDCVFCDGSAAETVLWRDDRCRVLLADEPDYPGFCRVVWSEHRAEMTDLSREERLRLLAVVFAVEEALRTLMAPRKVNLASLGNRVPHLHWHVIPRFADDPTFPDTVWSPAVRQRPSRPPRVDVERLSAEIAATLS